MGTGCWWFGLAEWFCTSCTGMACGIQHLLVYIFGLRWGFGSAQFYWGFDMSVFQGSKYVCCAMA